MILYEKDGWTAINLFNYIEYTEYPRHNFISISSEGRQKHQEYILHYKLGQQILLDDNFNLPNTYYLIYDDHIKSYPLLVRKKNDKIFEMDNYNSKHFLSSIIKNVFLFNYTVPTSIEQSSGYIKTNVSSYLFYYYIYYNNKVKLNIDEITDGVITIMSNCYMLMIDKELTTYRDYLDINDYINNIQIRLNMERMHNNGGIKYKFNIRK